MRLSDPPRTLRIEAIVTDKLGAPIANLRPEDFTLLDNGIAQKVDAAEWRSKRRPRVGPVAPASEIKDAADEERAAREPGTRLIALYLDEYHVSAGESTERVRAAVSRFIDEQVRPGRSPRGHEAARPPDGHPLHPRSRRARKAVSSFSGRRNDYTPRSPFEEQYLGRSPGAVRAARAQIVMSGLRALATRMGDLKGGLSGIVLMSEGFTTDVPRARERRLPDLQGLVRASSRFRVLLYAFDPNPVPPPPRDAAATDADDEVESSSVLQSLARQTGGDAVAAGQDLAPAFAASLDGPRFVLCADVHLDERERRALPHPSDHVEPAERAGARAIRLLGAASERVANDDVPPCAAAHDDAGTQAQPVHRLVVRPDRRA